MTCVLYSRISLAWWLINGKQWRRGPCWQPLGEYIHMLARHRNHAEVINRWYSCARREGASSEDMSATWKQIWQLVVRNISLPGVTRAACVLLHTLLETDLVNYHGVSNDINSIVTTADVNGPAIITDSTLLLMLHLLRLRNLKLPNASQTTCSHIIRWVFFRWDPSKSSQLHPAQLSGELTQRRGPLILLTSCSSHGAPCVDQLAPRSLWFQSSAAS